MLKGGLSDQLKNQPSMPELHQLLSQALEKRGQHLKQTWRGKGGIKFTLQVICHVKGGDPQWVLFSDKVGKEPIVNYTSCDVLLVSKILANAVNNPNQQNSISFKKPSIKPVSTQAKAASINNAAKISTQGQESAKASEIERAARKDLVSTQELSELKIDFSLSVAKEDKPTKVEEIPKYGDLSKFPIAELFYLIKENHATGRLDLAKDKLSSEVYFENGMPIDANASDAVGDDAIIELLTWKQGHYRFDQQVFKSHHTVHQSIEELKNESKNLSTHIEELKELGMLPTSTLNLNTSNPPEIDQSNGPKLDNQTILDFYQLLDGKRSIEDLTRDLSISRIKLLHLIHHLVVDKKIVTIKNQSEVDDSLLLVPKPIDTAAIQQVMMSLRRAETGMFIYPAFLYFLEQEYFRSYRTRSSFSVIVFELSKIDTTSDGDIRSSLGLDSIVDAVLRISNLKRHVDILAHYDDSKYSMLLPNTKAAGAKTFVNKFLSKLNDKPLNGIHDMTLSISLGTASVPEDFKNLSSLLGAADLAMRHAKASKQVHVQYKDIKDQVTLP